MSCEALPLLVAKVHALLGLTYKRTVTHAFTRKDLTATLFRVKELLVGDQRLGLAVGVGVLDHLQASHSQRHLGLGQRLPQGRHENDLGEAVLPAIPRLLPTGTRREHLAQLGDGLGQRLRLHPHPHLVTQDTEAESAVAGLAHHVVLAGALGTRHVRPRILLHLFSSQTLA